MANLPRTSSLWQKNACKLNSGPIHQTHRTRFAQFITARRRNRWKTCHSLGSPTRFERARAKRIMCPNLRVALITTSQIMSFHQASYQCTKTPLVQETTSLQASLSACMVIQMQLRERIRPTPSVLKQLSLTSPSTKLTSRVETRQLSPNTIQKCKQLKWSTLNTLSSERLGFLVLNSAIETF